MKKLVCFDRRAWIGLRKVLESSCLERKSNARRKKNKISNRNKDRDVQIYQSREREDGYFSLDGIRIEPWWERENWAMVTDPENPFGELTREEELRITELLKGDGVV